MSTTNRGRSNHWFALLVVVALIAAGLGAHLRWSLAHALPWQCDEVTVLLRFTGLCGNVANETEATSFVPSYYSFYMGALRSLQAPRYVSALHTTTGFWVNLTVHLFGVTPAAGRVGPLFWSMVSMGVAGWAAWLVWPRLPTGANRRLRTGVAPGLKTGATPGADLGVESAAPAPCSNLWQGVPAACLAMWAVALSPCATIYAAQARGYSEAMALAPLLLIALEHFRRRPDRWVRAILVLICALQASLTMYTVWIYWVLPTMVLAVAWLPFSFEKGSSRRFVGTVLIVLLVALCAIMALFTIDRWPSFAATGRRGLRFSDSGEVWEFVTRLPGSLLARPVWLSWLALAGVVVLWRSAVRWWLGVWGLALLVPPLFALANGSMGYERNLGHLLPAVAILFGLGGEALLRTLRRRWSPPRVAAVGACVLGVLSVWSYVGLESRARAHLPPDYGAAVIALEKEPETVGPRWVCTCLANHWQMDWYSAAKDPDAFLEVPFGSTIEVILAGRHDEGNNPWIYRPGPLGYLVEKPVPDYVAAGRPHSIRLGLELRRWLGTRIAENRLSSLNGETPLLVLLPLSAPPEGAPWGRFLADCEAQTRDILTFRDVRGTKGSIASLIAPASAWPTLRASAQRNLTADLAEMRVFALSPLAGP